MSSDVVLPAVRAVFTNGEVTALHVDAALGGSVSLALTVKGETFSDVVVQGGITNVSAEVWRERLRSNLVDFVAESRFGWGEDRDVPQP